MAHLLSIIEGPNTVSLSGSSTSSSQTLMMYIPRSPNLSTADSNSILRDGGVRPITTRRNVTESVSFRITGSDQSELQSTINEIERTLIHAERRQHRKSGSRIYANWQPEGSACVYRSELLGGKINPKEETLSWRWNRFDIEVDLAWTRMFYWEAPEVQIPLTNKTISNTLNEIDMVNHTDGDAIDCNYIDIAGSDLEGVMRGGTRIELKNDYVDPLAFLWMGQNVLGGGSAFLFYIQAEDATTGGSTVAAATSSCGNYRTRGWNTTSETELMEWTLTADQLQKASNNYFRVIARFHNGTHVQSTTFRWKIRLGSTGPLLWEGAAHKPDASFGTIIRDLGTIQLPPGALDLENPAPLRLELYGRRNQSGDHEINLDYIQFFGVDGSRHLWISGVGNNGWENEDWLYDDSINQRAYIDDGMSGSMKAAIVKEGNPIELYPNEYQRIYFLTHESSLNQAPIDAGIAAKVYYRPRFLTV